MSAGLALGALIPAQARADAPEAATAEATASPAPGAAEPAVPAAEPRRPTLRFDLIEVEVHGNTVLSAEEIQNVLSPYLGLDKTVEDVSKARAALEQYYQEERGYRSVVVDLPQQDLRIRGILRLDVVEGKVGTLAVTGAKYVSPRDVKSRVQTIAEGSVPSFPMLQAELKDANALSGYSVTPAFRPGVEPNTVDVDLQVDDDKPFGASFEINDAATQSTERLRAIASVSYSNLFQRRHSVSFQYQYAPQAPEQVEVYSGSYFFNLPGSYSSVVLYGVKSSTDVAATGDLLVLGKGEIYGGRVIVPLGDGDNGVYQALSFGGEYKDVSDTLTLLATDEEGNVDPNAPPANEDEQPVTYVNMVGGYRGVLTRRSFTTDFNLGVNFSLERVVSSQEQFELKRTDGDSGYIYLTGGFDHRQRFVPQLLEGVARFDFQVSPRPLISNQQFALGGVESVRGYPVSVALGDGGMQGTLQLDFTPPLPGAIGSLLNLRISPFLDGGYAQVQEPVTREEQDEFWLASTGLGLETVVANRFFARLDGGYAFTRRPEGEFRFDPAQNANVKQSKVDSDFGNWRLHFSMGLTY